MPRDIVNPDASKGHKLSAWPLFKNIDAHCAARERESKGALNTAAKLFGSKKQLPAFRNNHQGTERIFIRLLQHRFAAARVPIRLHNISPHPDRYSPFVIDWVEGVYTYVLEHPSTAAEFEDWTQEWQRVPFKPFSNEVTRREVDLIIDK